MTADQLANLAEFISAVESAEEKWGLFLSGDVLILNQDGKGAGVLHANGSSEHEWGES